MKYTETFKKNFLSKIKEAKNKNENISKVCALYNVPRWTAYEWIKKDISLKELFYKSNPESKEEKSEQSYTITNRDAGINIDDLFIKGKTNNFFNLFLLIQAAFDIIFLIKLFCGD